MSGRELDLDDSVVFDLNRHLGLALKQANPGSRDTPFGLSRPDASMLVDAVKNAAASISRSDEKIRHLEDRQRDFETLVDRIRAKLHEMQRLQQKTEAHARSETERANLTVTKSNLLQSQVDALEIDLSAALSDLNRIGDVITGSLVTGTRS